MLTSIGGFFIILADLANSWMKNMFFKFGSCCYGFFSRVRSGSGQSQPKSTDLFESELKICSLCLSLIMGGGWYDLYMNIPIRFKLFIEKKITGIILVFLLILLIKNIKKVYRSSHPSPRPRHDLGFTPVMIRVI